LAAAWEEIVGFLGGGNSPKTDKFPAKWLPNCVLYIFFGQGNELYKWWKLSFVGQQTPEIIRHYAVKSVQIYA